MPSNVSNERFGADRPQAARRTRAARVRPLKLNVGRSRGKARESSLRSRPSASSSGEAAALRSASGGSVFGADAVAPLPVVLVLPPRRSARLSSTLGARGGKRVSLRCGRGRRPRFWGKLRRCVALPVAALPGLTRWLRCRSFLSRGRIGGRACGGAPLAGFWSGGSLLFRSAVASLLTIRPTRRSKGRCAIKPRSAPELPRWASHEAGTRDGFVRGK